MKKTSATLTLAAVVGFTLLSASPAMAAPFQNCDQAALVGAYNIPIGSPAYNPNSDRDKDGIACENGDFGLYQDVATTTPAPVVTQAPQVAQMPVGGAATGVAQKPADNTAALALGGGLVLAAVAGGALVVRRRSA
ncbi:hypothetical protein IWX75_001480 [Arthrobacter sp. CAN_A6]|uniref:excalibur calcium-binding domain-containing protein n=1 Tax=Arthrobacter sp. CAN_A6 TaxID=2787721 RepID=UPI0018CA4129